MPKLTDRQRAELQSWAVANFTTDTFIGASGACAAALARIDEMEAENARLRQDITDLWALIEAGEYHYGGRILKAEPIAALRRAYLARTAPK